ELPRLTRGRDGGSDPRPGTAGGREDERPVALGCPPRPGTGDRSVSAVPPPPDGGVGRSTRGRDGAAPGLGGYSPARVEGRGLAQSLAATYAPERRPLVSKEAFLARSGSYAEIRHKG